MGKLVTKSASQSAQPMILATNLSLPPQCLGLHPCRLHTSSAASTRPLPTLMSHAVGRRRTARGEGNVVAIVLLGQQRRVCTGSYRIQARRCVLRSSAARIRRLVGSRALVGGTFALACLFKCGSSSLEWKIPGLAGLETVEVWRKPGSPASFVACGWHNFSLSLQYDPEKIWASCIKYYMGQSDLEIEISKTGIMQAGRGNAAIDPPSDCMQALIPQNLEQQLDDCWCRMPNSYVSFAPGTLEKNQSTWRDGEDITVSLIQCCPAKPTAHQNGSQAGCRCSNGTSSGSELAVSRCR
jgi:hypothetical protein